MSSPAHESAHDHGHAVHVKGYLAVFGALLALTVLTVAVSYLQLSTTGTVLVAVAIATVKATLVALFFMHLKRERPAIYWTLGLTGVLFVALFGFVLWTEADHLAGTQWITPFE
jgi:cytochrome c oxidase subunit 4